MFEKQTCERLPEPGFRLSRMSYRSESTVHGADLRIPTTTGIGKRRERESFGVELSTFHRQLKLG